MHRFNTRGFDDITNIKVDEILLQYKDEVKRTSQNCASSIDSDKIWNYSIFTLKYTNWNACMSTHRVCGLYV